MNDNNKKYDIFLSYAISDNIAKEWARNLVGYMQETFKHKTGRTLRVFIDVEDIGTAQMWQNRIYNSLRNSTVFVAVLSPSYFTSEWCCAEWDYFNDLEKAKRVDQQLTPEQGLIFPIKLVDLSKTLRLSTDEKARIVEAKKRQFIDFENLPSEEPKFAERINHLVENIIDVLFLLEESSAIDVEQKNKIALEKLEEKQKEQQVVLKSMGKRFKREEYIERLAKAARVTVIGITNDLLYQCLEDALVIKRQNEGNDAFWLSLRVVFLSETMLHHVDDDLTSEFPDVKAAARARIRVSDKAKRSIYFFLTHKGFPHNWDLYEYTYLLPFVGTIFEMPDGTQIAQVATLNPGYNFSEYLFFEFYSHDEELVYYQLAFQKVLGRSLQEEEIVLVGSPTSDDSGFICQNTRFRRNVLLGQADRKNDWIPAFVVILWCEETGKIWPLLQIRTYENASREIDMLSNISGYVNLKAYYELEKVTSNNAEFNLPERCFARATTNELAYELGLRDYHWPEPQLIKKIRFYYPDKENLFFYLCHIKINFPIDRVLPSAQLKKWSFGDILKVREFQVLSKIHEVLDEQFLGRDQAIATAQVLADNLILHRQNTLAVQLMEVIRSGEHRDELEKEVESIKKNKHVDYKFRGRTYPIRGLAGLQHREFFTLLVPFYASIDVEGAKEYLDWIQANAQSSFDNLLRHYSDPYSIQNVELDL